MIIRQATYDDYNVVEGLFDFIKSLKIDLLTKIGEENIFEILKDIYKSEQDRYSYKNCKIIEVKGKVEAFYFSYHYDTLKVAREYWVNDVQSKYCLIESDVLFDYDEVWIDEYYLDILYVFKDSRGKGLGKLLLKDFCATDYSVKSLNVDPHNILAKSLYESLGMKVVGQIEIAGKNYDHMVIRM